ncbi:phylloplanin-like [Phragmites australis]|uniref:phylloplanin-like n=1 Tax=Phragmites australis TaxID=29695 RepID=UPI002D789E9E|nr:phylloplanin-like [Phragmites australis]
MAPKSLVLAALLLVVATVVGQAPRGAEAGTSASTNVLISGIVPCGTGSSINVATVPVFPNAGLQLVCGSKVVAGATADGTGAFLINLGIVAPDQLTALLSNQCKVVVITPLGACNASLAGATGTLTAPVKLLGTATGSSGSGDPLSGIIGLIGQIIGGLLGGILNLVTQNFSLV